MAPLYHLLKNQSTFQWTMAQQESFDSVKQMFKSSDILQHFDSAHQLKLETDSSAFGLGAV